MTIRAARRDDYAAYARLFPHLGVPEPLPTPERFAADLAPRMLLAADGDDVVGYALYELLEGAGFVRNLVTDPARRRRGVGAALMEALRDHFRAAGLTQWCLNVKPDNLAAIALYSRYGFAARYRSAILRLARDVALPDPAASTVAPITPDEDAAVQARFDLLAGQLASARAKPGRQVLGLRTGDRIEGVAVFIADIPGAFPFRAVEPALGGAFAAHLRALAPPTATFLQLGVEDDDPLRDALLAAGARLHLDMLHMRAALG